MAWKSRQDGFFRALLRVFPAEFRGDFGEQMAADFREQRSSVEHRSSLLLLKLWARTAVDLSRRAPQEHVDVLWRDVVYAVRVLRRRPASTITVVLSLAIGIGLNIALFSVVSGVLWRSLPFSESDRLVRIFEVDSKSPDRTSELTNGNFADLRAQMHAFSAVAAGGYTSQTIVAPGEPEELNGMVVTEGFFETLGVAPALGRVFTPVDFAATGGVEFNRLAEPGESGLATSAIVISQALWQRRFLGRPDIIGQTLRLASGVSVEVVGVVGPEVTTFHSGFGAPPEWWLPQAAKPTMRRGQILDAVGRLAPGESLAAAQADLDVVAERLAADFPASNHGRGFRAVPLLDTVVKNVRGELTFLFGAVLCVLLVTCVNVVHLFLANASGRRVELATRAALGATRAHLVRQTLTESAVLAGMGGAGGLLLAAWAVPFLISIAPEGIPRLHEIRLDWVAFAFAAASSLGVALVCGIAASLPLTMLKPWTALAGSRSGGAIQGRRMRQALAVCEIGVALMLVVASLLMVRTMRSLAALDLGFNPQGVVAAGMPRPNDLHLRDGAAQLQRLHDTEASVIEEVRKLPGVVAAGVGGSPMGLSAGVQGARLPGDPRELGMVGLSVVSVGYFEALGAHLRAGRFFTADDRTSTPAVAIVGESAARQFWPGGTALGQTLILPAAGPVRIVGVVADMAEFGLLTKAGGIFLPHVQSSYVTGGAMLIRTDGDPQRLVPAIKSIVRRVNPEQPFPGVVPLQDQIDAATAPRRFILRLVGIFSALGLLLAVIGIYGVLAESVAERVPEIGVRMALGAQASDVVAMFLRQGGWMVAAGLGLGLIGAFALRDEMTTIVVGVPTVDPVSYLAACVALAIAALTACAIPARRAARLDPVMALRTE